MTKKQYSVESQPLKTDSSGKNGSPSRFIRHCISTSPRSRNSDRHGGGQNSKQNRAMLQTEEEEIPEERRSRG
ncbi:hypothetical protein KFK09_022573 [Dendrobium nobile]|uniref:Uncharacterized protein n=1 Tax=Dendrobium nobile TaxID=94219 RepID=A0A8T3AIW7_DENNO|nr:hypothetical protein KFK09_022573 [Dendrobium nobile]